MLFPRKSPYVKMNMLKSVSKTEKIKNAPCRKVHFCIYRVGMESWDNIYEYYSAGFYPSTYRTVDWLHSKPEAAFSVLEIKT